VRRFTYTPHWFSSLPMIIESNKEKHWFMAAKKVSKTTEVVRFQIGIKIFIVIF
jgi:hypothetical protein